MENLYANQEDILIFAKSMCNKFACNAIQEIFDNENMSNIEKLERADIALEIYRRTKDETDIKKINESMEELKKELQEKRENGEV